MLFNDEEKTPEKEPIKNSPTTQYHLKCSSCGFEADRDVVGSWNIRLKALKIWESFRSSRMPVDEGGGWKVSRRNRSKVDG